LVEDGIEIREIVRAGGALDRFLALEQRCGSHMGPPLFIVVKGVDYLSDSGSLNSHAINPAFQTISLLTLNFES